MARFGRFAGFAFSVVSLLATPVSSLAETVAPAFDSDTTKISSNEAGRSGISNSPFRYVDGQKAPDAGYARPNAAAREELEIAVEQMRRRQTDLEDRIEALERRLGAAGVGR